MKATFAADRKTCRDLICLSCPNGCRLAVAVRVDRCVEIRGNGCEKGLEFVRSALEDETCAITARGPSAVHGEKILKEIAASWGISVKAVRPRLIPSREP